MPFFANTLLQSLPHSFTALYVKLSSILPLARMHSVLGQITPAESKQRKHFQLSVDVADEQCRLSSSLIPTQAISWPRAAFLRIQSCYLQLINSCRESHIRFCTGVVNNRIWINRRHICQWPFLYCVQPQK